MLRFNLDEKLNTSGSAGSGTNFYFDYQDGSYGFNTSPLRGADTFNPFSQGSDITKLYTSNTTISSTTTIPISGSSDYDYLIVEVIGLNSSYGNLTQYIMLDNSGYPFQWRYPISGGGRGLDFSRSGNNLVCTYPSGTEGWGNIIKNVWGGNTITPPIYSGELSLTTIYDAVLSSGGQTVDIPVTEGTYYIVITGNLNSDGLNYGSVSGLSVTMQYDKSIPVYSKGATIRIYFGAATGSTIRIVMTAQRYSSGLPVIIYQVNQSF